MTAVRCEMCAHRIAVCLKVTCEQSVYRNVPGYKDGFRKFVFPTSDFPRASGLGYYKLLYSNPHFREFLYESEGSRSFGICSHII